MVANVRITFAELKLKLGGNKMGQLDDFKLLKKD